VGGLESGEDFGQVAPGTRRLALLARETAQPAFA